MTVPEQIKGLGRVPQAGSLNLQGGQGMREGGGGGRRMSVDSQATLMYRHCNLAWFAFLKECRREDSGLGTWQR